MIHVTPCKVLVCTLPKTAWHGSRVGALAIVHIAHKSAFLRKLVLALA